MTYKLLVTLAENVKMFMKTQTFWVYPPVISRPFLTYSDIYTSSIASIVFNQVSHISNDFLVHQYTLIYKLLGLLLANQ